MTAITREAFLALKDSPAGVFHSDVWGGDICYRPATVGDKSNARRRATIPGDDGRPVLDNERLEAAIILECALDGEGKRLFQPQDLAAMMERNGGEVSRLAAAILGADRNPR